MVGMLHELQNNKEEAKRWYEKALVADASAPVAANNLAWLTAEQGGNLDVAMQLAQTAKARLPDSPQVDDTLGWVYYKKGLHTLAIGVIPGEHPEGPEESPLSLSPGPRVREKRRQGQGARIAESGAVAESEVRRGIGGAENSRLVVSAVIERVAG